MIVTAIEAQKRNEQRVNVYGDGKFWVSLDIYQVIELGIKIGKEFTGKDKAAIEDESIFGKSYAAALNYVSIRPRSEKELSDYAWRKKWDPQIRDKVIARLKEKGYLNDEAFARQWVNIRESGKPMSRRRIQQELRQKGITSSAADEVLSDYDEQASLKSLIDKKRQRYSDPMKFKQYLLRQGFSYDAIETCLKDGD